MEERKFIGNSSETHSCLYQFTLVCMFECVSIYFAFCCSVQEFVSLQHSVDDSEDIACRMVGEGLLRADRTRRDKRMIKLVRLVYMYVRGESWNTGVHKREYKCESWDAPWDARRGGGELAVCLVD